MSVIVRAACVALACLLFPIEMAAAQPANMGCVTESPANAPQTLRCEGGVTIVAENGARFTLQDRDGNGRVAVGRRTGTHSVTLGPGEGVDVEATRGPLTVKRWPKARVAALMARLGQ